MIRPGDAIAGGACGMGPCPPLQHQPPGGAYAHDMHCISMYMYIHVYTMYMSCIYMVYTMYIHIPWINLVYTKWVCSIPFL